MTQRMTTLVSSCLAIAACATLAACSSPTGNPQPGGGPPGVTTRTAAALAHANVSQTYCRQAPASLVGPALRLPAGTLSATVEPPVTVCAYAGREEIIVRYQVGEGPAQFAADKSSMTNLHQAVTTVGGLGDGAFYAQYTSGRQLSNTLAARKGVIAVFITSPAALRAEESLMSKLLARL